MKSAHKPIIIPPVKRAANKKYRHKVGSGSGIPPNIRRIHSQDIVTRMPECLMQIKTPESPSFSKQRSLSQDIITLKSQSQASTLECRSLTPDVEPSAAEEFSFGTFSTHCGSIRESNEEQTASIANQLELGNFSNTSTSCNSEAEESVPEWSSPSRNVNICLPPHLQLHHSPAPQSSLKALQQQIEALEVEAAAATEESALNIPVTDHYLTLTGTIKRGKKAGQCIDVKLNMSREELEKLEADLSKKLQPKEQVFGTKSGIHIMLFSLLVSPIVFLISGIYSFYLGTYTWYNIYLHFSDERTIWHKIFICPLLVLTYPLWFPPTFIGLGLFAAAVQISWYYDRWLSEVQDLEKGFFGWLCSALKLGECSPYEVIVLNDVPAGKDAKITETTML